MKNCKDAKGELLSVIDEEIANAMLNYQATFKRQKNIAETFFTGLVNLNTSDKESLKLLTQLKHGILIAAKVSKDCVKNAALLIALQNTIEKLNIELDHEKELKHMTDEEILLITKQMQKMRKSRGLSDDKQNGRKVN